VSGERNSPHEGWRARSVGATIGGVRRLPLTAHLVFDPGQVFRAPADDREGDDLGDLVGVQRPYAGFQDCQAGGSRLEMAVPLRRLINPALPAVDAGDGALDLGTGGQAFRNRCPGDPFRFLPGGAGRGDLQAVSGKR
jgi:hypothetical protein